MKKIITLALATLMLLCVLTACNPDAEEIDWINLRLGSALPEPQSNLMKIVSNDDNDLLVYIYKISQNQYLEYQRWCEQEKGFDIETETLSNSFYAYNGEGYYLSLYYNDSQDQMHITLKAPMPMEPFVLPEYAVIGGLPAPESKVGYFSWQNEKGFFLYVGETTKDNYMLYKDACVAAGFTIDPYEYNTVYSATNAEGYKVSLNYKGFDTFTLEFRVPESNNEKSDNIEESDETEYTLDYSDVASFETALNEGEKVKGSIVRFEVNDYKPNSILGINCLAGEHLNFISEEELDVGKGNVITGRITEEPTKSLGSWVIFYDVLSISGEKVEEDTTDVQPSKITLTMSADDFKGMNYNEAEKIFREMGFTKFKYQTVRTETESANDTIYYIDIVEWIFGDTDFVKGDKFDVDSTVTFWSYKYEAPVAPSPVYYSTNDYKTAQNGNSGIFSYKNKSGTYDVYWIIDFDHGYVYYFTEGNGESTCDRVKMVSGTLNDRITITWHDGDDQTTWYLHFKYVNSPVTLIVNDHLGFAVEFTTTDLDDALALRATKEIIDY
jgi:hypothetical protein